MLKKGLLFGITPNKTKEAAGERSTIAWCRHFQQFDPLIVSSPALVAGTARVLSDPVQSNSRGHGIVCEVAVSWFFVWREHGLFVNKPEILDLGDDKFAGI